MSDRAESEPVEGKENGEGSMLSTKERQHIIDKVQFEQEVRASLSPEPDVKSSESPLKKIGDAVNSGFVLLIAGSLVSAVVIPRLQSHQQEIEWRRQIRSDSAKFKIGMMRDCLQEFMGVNSYGAQAIELGKQIDSPDRLSGTDYKEFRSQINKLISSSTERSAKAVAMSVSFPDATGTRTAIWKYDENLQQYIDTVERLLETKYAFSRKQTTEQRRQFKVRLERLSQYAQQPLYGQAFEECVSKITNQISDQEVIYEKSVYNNIQ